MIRIEFFRSEKLLTGFQASGHAEYAESGADIVCAFVSSACYMAANTITDVIGLRADAADDESGRLRLDIKENPARAQDILKGLKLHLSELQKDYPENINVIISEV